MGKKLKELEFSKAEMLKLKSILENISLFEYKKQVNTNIYYDLTSNLFEDIKEEGWVGELEKFYNIDINISNFKYTTLNLSINDKQGLINFCDNTLEKFNDFDIKLKENQTYPFNIIDFINYDNGVVYIIKFIK